jgi:hypothetical protein
VLSKRTRSKSSSSSRPLQGTAWYHCGGSAGSLELPLSVSPLGPMLVGGCYAVPYGKSITSWWLAAGGPAGFAGETAHRAGFLEVPFQGVALVG